MELIILGSSGAIPIKGRNLPSIALKYKNEILLFDCGEDLQRAFEKASLKFNRPLKIFISHFHGDHVIGLPGLLFRFGLLDRTAPVEIYGPRNLFYYLFLHSKILGLRAPYPLTVKEIDPENEKLLIFEGLKTDTPAGEQVIEDDIIYESKRYFMKYTLVKHSILSFAFAFHEKPRFGKFNPEKAEELGIPPSNLWKKMQHGETITHQGNIIDPLEEGIVGPPRPGKKITYSGDLAPCESIIRLGKDTDILIHEATYAKDLADVAAEKFHSTSVDAATDALKMNAKKLILTHFSSRYNSPDILLKEAKEIFPNTILAEDQLKLKLRWVSMVNLSD